MVLCTFLYIGKSMIIDSKIYLMTIIFILANSVDSDKIRQQYVTYLLALLYVMFYCVFITFQCGVLGQVWCLIVSFPDLCLLSYLNLSLFWNQQL